MSEAAVGACLTWEDEATGRFYFFEVAWSIPYMPAERLTRYCVSLVREEVRKEQANHALQIGFRDRSSVSVHVLHYQLPIKRRVVGRWS